MRYEIEVTLETDVGADEVFTVKVDGREIAEWESRHGSSFMQHTMTYTDQVEMAWAAAVRMDVSSLSLDEWKARCVSARDVPKPLAAAHDNPMKKGRGGKSRSVS